MSSILSRRSSISKQRGAAISSKLIPPKAGAILTTVSMISSVSCVSKQIGNAFTPPNSLKRAAFPVMDLSDVRIIFPGENDVYVSPSQIRRFNLKTGDILTEIQEYQNTAEKFSALLYLARSMEMSLKQMHRNDIFEDMTPIFPNERLQSGKRQHCNANYDLISPIGKGTERNDRITAESR